nr:unnamed protein product [Callosobruchus chinensis]
MEERDSENPLAYRQNKLEYQLTEQEVDSIKNTTNRRTRPLSD